MKISVIIQIYNCEDKTKRYIERIFTQGIEKKKIIRNESGEVNDYD